MRQFLAAGPERDGWLAEILPGLRDALGGRPGDARGGAQVWQTPEVALLTAPLTSLRHEAPGVDTEIDVEAIVASFLSHPPLQRLRTPLRGVAKVPQGGLARVRSGRVTVRDYWSPVACPSTDSQMEVIAQLRDLLAVVVDDSTQGVVLLARISAVVWTPAR